MKHTFQIYTYRLPLKRPIKTPVEILSHREGFLLHATAEDGREGWGEVAPLSGFSRESLVEAENELRFIVKNHGEELREYTSSLSSVQFGIDQCLAEIKSSRFLPKQKKIAVNYLLSGEPDDVLDQAKTGLRKGYSCFKLKVGKTEVEADIELVSSLRNELRKEAKLRLDANRAWALNDALRFGKAMEPDWIDYIEEPLGNPNDLASFHEQTGLKVALDESLMEPGAEKFFAAPEIDALVLKPSLLGGLRRAQYWIAHGQRFGKRITVTSLFESGVGLLGLADFLLQQKEPLTESGLATQAWFSKDTTLEPLPIVNGEVEGQQLKPAGTMINYDMLEEIR